MFEKVLLGNTIYDPLATIHFGCGSDRAARREAPLAPGGKFQDPADLLA